MRSIVLFSNISKFTYLFSKTCLKYTSESISCQSYGDPHFNNFDSTVFSYQGGCIYDLVTTQCSGNENVSVYIYIYKQ